jgi:chromosome partitioning protein
MGLFNRTRDPKPAPAPERPERPAAEEPKPMSTETTPPEAPSANGSESSLKPPEPASEIKLEKLEEEPIEKVLERVERAKEKARANPTVTVGAEQPAKPAATAEPDQIPEDDRISYEEALAPVRKRVPMGVEAPEEPKTARAKVISFANQKGGVAKTTTTLNLAVAFRESGHDVLCVDLDPQGNLTMSQGIDPDKVEKSMYDVLVDKMPIREIIQTREIDIAVASIDLAGAEIAMSTQIGRERSLEKAFAPIKDDYDFICIDTPPSLGLLTINALTASDKVIVPVQCEYLSMRGLVQLQNTLEMIRENLNPGVEIEGILPTMLDSRTVHAKEAVEILEENFGDLVFKSRIRKAVKFAEAPVRGTSVLKYDPNGNAARYYRELAEEVLTNGSS